MTSRYCASLAVLHLSLFLVVSIATAGELSLDSKPFGRMPDGVEVRLYTLSNGDGLRAQVMPFGATIVAVETPDRAGKWANITLRQETFEDYLTKPTVYGTIIGRYANRIGGAKFTIDGVEYNVTKNAGPHHIHGGKQAFHRVLWKADEIKEDDRVGVRMTYVSRDGEEGFPGTLKAHVTYAVTRNSELIMDYEATTDKPTHVNLTNHAYWNLTGVPDEKVLGHEVTIKADFYLAGDAALIPSGELLSVKGTPFDFNRPTTIGARIDESKIGYDHCYVLRKPSGERIAKAAFVVEPKSGRTMLVSTTQPGVQLYTDGRNRRALCLETQHYPDSPNKPSFPSTLLRPGETYRETTVHRFGVVTEKP